jgi:hypothetical protein
MSRLSKSNNFRDFADFGLHLQSSIDIRQSSIISLAQTAKKIDALLALSLP